MSRPGGLIASPEAMKRLKKRYRAEARFRSYGLAAIAFAIASLVVLLVSIAVEAVSAFSKHELSVELLIDPEIIDPTNERDPVELASNVSAFSELIRAELHERFPDAAANIDMRRQLNRMVSTLSGGDLARRVAANPALIGQTVRVAAPVSDVTDLYLKGLITDERVANGNVVANLSPSALPDGRPGLTIAAPGGFGVVYQDMVDRLRAEARARSDAADVSQAAISRIEDRLERLTARRDGLARAPVADVRSEASAVLAPANAADVALALAVGRARANGSAEELRAALAADVAAEAATAEAESAELLKRGQDFTRKARTAEVRGEPIAETRRIQASTALLASDRARIEARVLRDRVAALDGMSIDQLVAIASLSLNRAAPPLAELTVGGAPAADAVVAVNAIETAAAGVAVEEQQRRITHLRDEASVLEATAPERAEAIRDTALPAAESRLRRLSRDFTTLQETGATLSALLAGEPMPVAAGPDTGQPAATPREFLQAEMQAQLGLDVGGPLAVAMALGSAQAGAPGADAVLTSLMIARGDLAIAEARRDIDRLSRKRDRDTEAANLILSRISTPGVAIEPDEFSPSLLVEINGGAVKALRITADAVTGEVLIPPTALSPAASGAWRLRELETSEADRLLSDRQAAWANALRDAGDIRRVANFDLLTRADSTYPELAGLAAALAGSFWIMIVTLVLSLPIGVMAAIYLEEFAPRNRITDLIEVNINNLAAVPSIVFGLLGAAVFINFFNLPRSAPVVGGLVLSLITLPTIIIATRAALGAVPPSIREGALAVGASLPQTVFHHVLPLAAPGIMTGAIIGLARALGETAPLLLIGMVAFVAEPPASMFDSATALPVLVYKWSSAAERAWQPMTSAAIIVLLVFMFAMNALAVYLRRRLERRW